MNIRHRSCRQSIGVVSVILVLAMILTACGSSKPAASSTGTASSTAGTVKIMVIGPWGVPILDLSDSPTIVRNGANAQNTAGGIKKLWRSDRGERAGPGGDKPARGQEVDDRPGTIEGPEAKNGSPGGQAERLDGVGRR
jgi:hypothetical protein